MATWNSRGLRGSELEEIVNLTNEKYREKHLDKLLPAAEDLILINGALGLCTFDGTESEFSTNYHPDDVMSEYGTDLQFFADNCGKQKCRVKVFESEKGPDWMTV